MNELVFNEFKYDTNEHYDYDRLVDPAPRLGHSRGSRLRQASGPSAAARTGQGLDYAATQQALTKCVTYKMYVQICKDHKSGPWDCCKTLKNCNMDRIINY